MPAALVPILGIVTGALFAFGAAVALFDWAHQGPNTDPWQVVVGGFLPALLLLGTIARIRDHADRRRLGVRLLLTLILGFLLGVGALVALPELA